MSIEIAELDFKGNKFKVAHDPALHYTLFTHVDEDSVRQRWWDIKPGDVILDIGSAFGSYALAALAQGAAFAVCWSPQGEDPLLKQSLELNGWDDKALIVPRGLWSKSGYLHVYDGTPMSTFSEEAPDVAERDIFPVDTLDSIVAGLRIPPFEKIHWIKIDVEGAELEVLLGSELTIRKHKPKILVENHDFKDPQLHARCDAFLAGLDVGYREVGTVPHHSVSHTLYSTEV